MSALMQTALFLGLGGAGSPFIERCTQFLNVILHFWKHYIFNFSLMFY